MTPTISTDRLTLRPLTKATPRQVAWLRDPEVVRWSQQQHREHTLSSQLRYVSSFAGRSCLWAICLVENGEHIGNLTATVDEPNGTADVGILIGETRAWGKGLGTEAFQRACSWLLDPNLGGLRKLEAGCAKANLGMMRIIQKAGFRQEGELLNHFVFGGGQVSAMVYGRMR